MLIFPKISLYFSLFFFFNKILFLLQIDPKPTNRSSLISQQIQKSPTKQEPPFFSVRVSKLKVQYKCFFNLELSKTRDGSAVKLDVESFGVEETVMAYGGGGGREEE